MKQVKECSRLWRVRVCVYTRVYPRVHVRDVHDMRVGRPSFSPLYVALSLRHRVIDQS